MGVSAFQEHVYALSTALVSLCLALLTYVSIEFTEESPHGLVPWEA